MNNVLIGYCYPLFKAAKNKITSAGPAAPRFDPDPALSIQVHRLMRSHPTHSRLEARTINTTERPVTWMSARKFASGLIRPHPGQTSRPAPTHKKSARRRFRSGVARG